MTDDILSSDQRTEAMMASDVPARLSLAGLPTTLIVSGLEDQLARGAVGYTDSDYLSPILESFRLLQDRYEGDSDRIAEIRNSFSRILDRVAEVIGADWGVSLDQLGIDASSVDYAGDVLEMYRFFVVDRQKNADNLAYHLITADRRRLADRYRKSVDKKNQTVSEVRRIFASFDDVVIWISLPAIVEGMQAEGGPLGTFTDTLGMLQIDGTMFLRSVAWRFPDDTFLGRYLLPTLTNRRISLALELRSRWLEESPRKNPNSTEDNNE